MLRTVDGTPAARRRRPARADRRPARSATVVRVGYERDGTLRRRRAVTTTASGDDGEPRPVIGVVTREEPSTRRSSVTITLEDVGGPSAGLMFALGILDKLGEPSLTGGAVHRRHRARSPPEGDGRPDRRHLAEARRRRGQGRRRLPGARRQLRARRSVPAPDGLPLARGRQPRRGARRARGAARGRDARVCPDPALTGRGRRLSPRRGWPAARRPAPARGPGR